MGIRTPSHIIFLAAGDQGTLLAGNIFPSNTEGEQLVDDAFDLGGDGTGRPGW